MQNEIGVSFPREVGEVLVDEGVVSLGGPMETRSIDPSEAARWLWSFAGDAAVACTLIATGPTAARKIATELHRWKDSLTWSDDERRYLAAGRRPIGDDRLYFDEDTTLEEIEDWISRHLP